MIEAVGSQTQKEPVKAVSTFVVAGCLSAGVASLALGHWEFGKWPAFVVDGVIFCTFLGLGVTVSILSGWVNLDLAWSRCLSAAAIVITTPLISAIVIVCFGFGVAAIVAILLSAVGVTLPDRTGMAGGIVGASILAVVFGETSAALLYWALDTLSPRRCPNALRKLLLSAAILSFACVIVDYSLTNDITEPTAAFRGATLFRLLRFALEPAFAACVGYCLSQNYSVDATPLI